MANKKGFAYYNIDTDRYQDIRIKRLKKSFGCVGLAVYDYILCEIYRVEGCFSVWDDCRAFDVADYLGLKEQVVEEIVKYCGVVGLLTKVVLSGETVLTSAAIQARYIDMCRRAKRQFCEIPEEIRLIPEKIEKLPEETLKLPEELHRVEKSKVNNIYSLSSHTHENENLEKNDPTTDKNLISPPGSGAPPQYSAMEDIHELKQSYKRKGEPRQMQLMRHAPSVIKTLDDAWLWLDKFVEELELKGDTFKTQRDFDSHFVNWLKFQKDAREQTATKNIRNGTAIIAKSQTDDRAQREQRMFDRIIAPRKGGNS